MANKPSKPIEVKKDKIVKNAKLIPMTSIDEALNEDTDRSDREIGVKTKIMKLDCDQIEKEELDKVRKSSMFVGYKIREEHFKFDDLIQSALTVAGKGKKARRNPELQEAIALESKGYSKPGMTEDEIREEKTWINQQYSLDFMLDDEDIQEDKEVYDIILSEITKTKE